MDTNIIKWQIEKTNNHGIIIRGIKELKQTNTNRSAYIHTKKENIYMHDEQFVEQVYHIRRNEPKKEKLNFIHICEYSRDRERTV